MEHDIKNLTNSMEVVSQAVAKILDTMATKDDVEKLRLETKTEFTQLRTELRDFKEETRDNFDKVEKRFDDIEETIEGVVEDYHPRIIRLEEKVFGVASLE